jgi:glyoxylase-like metal-dependent hydrolase (beta-lactamase superfamily II)
MSITRSRRARDLALIGELRLELDCTLDTHIHADHLTGAKKAKALCGSRDDTLVYPGHDYSGRFVSSIAQEKARNPRIGHDQG